MQGQAAMTRAEQGRRVVRLLGELEARREDGTRLLPTLEPIGVT